MIDTSRTSPRRSPRSRGPAVRSPSGAALQPTLDAGHRGRASHGTGAEVAVVWLPERDGSLVARAVGPPSGALAAEIEGAAGPVGRDRRRSSSARSLGRATLSASRCPARRRRATPGCSSSPAAAGRSTARRAASPRSPPISRGSRSGCATTAPRWAGRSRSRSTSRATRSPPSRTTSTRRTPGPPGCDRLGAESALVWRLRADELRDRRHVRPAGAGSDSGARGARDPRRAPHGRGRRATGGTGRARHAPARPAAARRAAAPLRSRPRPGRRRPRPARELRRPRRSRTALVRAGARGRLRARAQPRAARGRRRGDRTALALAHARHGDRACSPSCSAPTASPSTSARTTAGRRRPRAGRRGPARGGRRARCSPRRSRRARPGASSRSTTLPRDERLEPARPQAAESGIDSALALPLVVGDEPIGLLAVYPRQPRPLTANESALLVALAAQLAVARPERPPARARDGARRRARGGARVGARGGEAAATRSTRSRARSPRASRSTRRSTCSRSRS